MPPGSTKSRSTSPSSSGKYSPPTTSPTSPLSSNAWQHSRIDTTAPPNHSVGNTPAPTSTNTSPDSTTTPLPHDPRRINGQDHLVLSRCSTQDPTVRSAQRIYAVCPFLPQAP